MKTIAFFNSKSGVGKTWLVYHLAWMFADRGLKVVAVDLDPQAKLSSFFLEEDRLIKLWPDGEHPQSLLGAVKPFMAGATDIAAPHVEEIADNIGLVAGDLGLAVFEDNLAEAWSRSVEGDQAAFQIATLFSRVITQAARMREAGLVLIDVGSNLSAVTRAAMIAAEFVVAPLLPDLFCLQSLRTLGSALRRWREQWSASCAKNPESIANFSANRMQPVGYLMQLPAMRLDRPSYAYGPAITGVPGVYRESVLGEAAKNAPAVSTDPYALPLLRHYIGLKDMAAEAHKPMFFLTPADGAFGSHAVLRVDCYRDYKALAMKIAERCGVAFS